MPNSSLLENSSDTIQLIAMSIKKFRPFPKVFFPKVNVIPQLEIELTELSLSSTLHRRQGELFHIYIYIYESIFRQQVIIQASFVKDDGTLFIIFILFFKNSLLFF